MLKLFHSGARVGDQVALRRLFDELPDVPAAVRARVERGEGMARRWHQGRSLWLASDGATVLCIAIVGLSRRQAAELRRRFDALDDDAVFGSVGQLGALLSEVTGAPINEVLA